MTTYFWSFAKSADNIYILLDLTTDNISWEIRINLFIMGIEATTESEKSSESHLLLLTCGHCVKLVEADSSIEMDEDAAAGAVTCEK